MTDERMIPYGRGLRLVLASASPRRIALMREYGYDVEVVVPFYREPDAPLDDPDPAQHAQAISYFKARSVAGQVRDGLILAGDTLVSAVESLFGKPVDRNDARAMLSALAGTTHRVITGVTLLNAATGARLIEHESTAVTMRRLSETEISVYLDTGAWEGKAGAYGIQDRADAFIERIDGSFTNVVGLPMERVARMLRAWGVTPRHGPPSNTGGT